MQKLCDNIENININGDVGQLSEVVTAMDILLQNIAEGTERITELLVKSSASNKGAQYQKIVSTTMTLRDVLYKESVDLNEMQNQVVAYQNKIYKYEEIHANAQNPNPFLVTKRQISIETSAVQFDRAQMVNIAAALKNYIEFVTHHVKTIIEKKTAIAGIWRDAQYNLFAESIDKVTQCIMQALNNFAEYVTYLEEKIKELD